jgi:hypothetical protein
MEYRSGRISQEYHRWGRPARLARFRARSTAGWAARYLWTRRWRFARERLIETKLAAGRERCGVELRLAYWVAQVCNADARDHRRVAQDGWRAGEVVKESNSGAKKNYRDLALILIVVLAWFCCLAIG